SILGANASNRVFEKPSAKKNVYLDFARFQKYKFPGIREIGPENNKSGHVVQWGQTPWMRRLNSLASYPAGSFTVGISVSRQLVWPQTEHLKWTCSWRCSVAEQASVHNAYFNVPPSSSTLCIRPWS